MARFLRRPGLRWCALLALAGATSAQAALVVDDAGQRVAVAGAAQRIVSLAPGITELLFALGAGERVVAASEYSDYPEAARRLPRVARAQSIDLEQIARSRPDLIVTWGSGYSPALLDGLRRLGVPVYIHEPRSLEGIAQALERLGALTASPKAAPLAADFRARVTALRAKYGGRSAVRVFYQVWGDPLMTLTDRSLAGEVLRLCGARNVFGDLAPLVAGVDTEAVLAARPQIILTAEAGGADRGALDSWKRFAGLPAVAGAQLLTIDADKFDRAALRILDAAEELCGRIDRAREQAAAKP